uniref:Putative callose synthase 8 isoform X2 n=1 Tax=Rhizophora mucronata TaxID=61149 RepID=A0A2P2IKK3_RHIMU
MPQNKTGIPLQGLLLSVMAVAFVMMWTMMVLCPLTVRGCLLLWQGESRGFFVLPI